MKIPGHIAIIMDGNGRWARKRNLPRIFGHRGGIKTVDIITEECAELGVKALTLYTFSSENWSRPEQEVKALMELLRDNLIKYGEKLKNNNIKFNTIGKTELLPLNLQESLIKLKEETSINTGMVLTLALNYGGRQEIVEAFKKAFRSIDPENVDDFVEKDMEEFLYTRSLPELDLVIRTSGEMRISNFLLWQCAYAEFYFTEVLWPDFDVKELRKALEVYGERERRFGG